MEFLEQENTAFALAAAFVNNTRRHLFLTGKAGTGKTTFLKYIKTHCAKKLVVAAPTGVAAINAGGVTLHSLFQLPFGTYLPEPVHAGFGAERQPALDKHQLLSKLKIKQAKLQLIRELELLIIDEASMLRCDVLDMIDEVLRFVRQKPLQPFGGVQMLYIGDLFQLPPVVKNEDAALLNKYYATPFFFDTVSLKAAPPLYLELKKIYRQSNEQFIELLNRVRNNELSEQDLRYLNSFYRSNFSPAEEDNYITLASHNAIADRINQQALQSLPGKLHSFEAVVERDFPEHLYPMEKILYLKEGAQIMFIKNDKGDNRKFYNGKIGVVDSIKEGVIKIRFNDEADLLELKTEKWQHIQYSYNNDADRIEEEEIGTFSQYPIRLAWAITIHKSQGLTFDRAVIDAGASFAAGQVYVALSRLRSLDGLVLRTRIPSSAIATDESVIDFSARQPDEPQLHSELAEAQKQYVFQSIVDTFDWRKPCFLLEEFIEKNDGSMFKEETDFMAQLKLVHEKIIQQKITAEKFEKQLNALLTTADEKGFSQLHTRISSACKWFNEVLKNEIILPLQSQLEFLNSRKRTKKLRAEMENLITFFERKQQQLHRAVSLTEMMRRSPKVKDWLDSLQIKNEINNAEPQKSVVEKFPKGATKQISLEMYQSGKTIEEIALLRNLTKGTIEGHLLNFIPTGEVSISVFLTENELKELGKFMQENSEKSASEIYTSFNEKYSYSQIKAVRLLQTSEQV